MASAHQAAGTSRRSTGWVIAGFAATGLLTAAVIAQVLRSGTDSANTSAPGYLPLAWMAALVLVIAFGLAIVVRRVDITVARWLPWLVGVVSLLVSLVPWWILAAGGKDTVARIYAGLHVPQGIVAFWDLDLVLKSIDCSRFGFDVFAANNGCLKDPAIYGPGVLWLKYIPGHPISESALTVLGVLMMVISSLVLAWLARQSRGVGPLVLLAAAVGGPWLLLLERGNLDAVVLWAAALCVLLVRRWDRLWAWFVAAGIIWILGTWKYYPLALGVLLVPALRLRRGWTVLVAWLVASLAFLALDWQGFRASSAANTAMTNLGDFVVLGRTTLVSRMLGTTVGAPGWQGNDLLVLLLALVAVAFGVAVGVTMRRLPVHPAMLAASGSLVFLASVLIAGFGWGYKAAFLLLNVPLLASVMCARRAALVASGTLAMALVAISSFVVWNTVLATTAGIVAASFSAGLGGAVLVRSVRVPQGSGQPR